MFKTILDGWKLMTTSFSGGSNYLPLIIYSYCAKQKNKINVLYIVNGQIVIEQHSGKSR